MALHQWHFDAGRDGGRTTFNFVTHGFENALALARRAGTGGVDVAGGASTVRQALAGGEFDELTLDIVPVRPAEARGSSTVTSR